MTKRACADFINEAGALRILMTNFRGMLSKNREVFRDPDTLIGIVTAAELAMQGICRSQMREADGGLWRLEPVIDPPPRVYEPASNPKPMADPLLSKQGE